jgi:hypothetical protein
VTSRQAVAGAVSGAWLATFDLGDAIAPRSIGIWLRESRR